MANHLKWLLPVTLLAFVGPTVSYLSVVFSNAGRWVFLALLAVQQLVVRRRQFGNNPFVFLLFIYTIWCIVTTFWSEAPDLSLYKSVMFFVASFTMVFAGHGWVARHGVGKSFDYLVPTVVVTYLAAILGFFFSPARYHGIGFQGFVNGANMLGSLLNISAPLVFWRLYSNWGNIRRRNWWMALAGLCFVFLLMTHSRSALLVVLLTLGGYLLSMRVKKQIMTAYLAVLLLALGSMMFADEGSGILQQLIYKNSKSIFASRVSPWTESLEKANLGGWMGGGYGVSIGYDAWEGGSFTAFGYGREKGNAQLAVMEETGVVGLALYAMTLFTLFYSLLVRFRTIVDMDIRTALGVAIGGLAGMAVQTVFEAWWVAPGAPESIVFWTLAGVSLGLADLGREHSLRQAARVWSQHVAKLRIDHG